MLILSRSYIYISDIVNQRIVQVRMEYALDNIRGLTDYAVMAE